MLLNLISHIMFSMDNWATDHRFFKLSTLVLFIALFTVCPLVAVKAVIAQEASTSFKSTGDQYKPVGPIEYRVLQARPQGINSISIAEADDDGDARRRLAPFQLCLPCKCCTATAASTCTTMPCCFGIDCQLPNKPFGVCAFVPKTCNCTSCAS